MTSRVGGLATLLVLTFACSTSHPTATSTNQSPSAAPTASVHTFAGGCAGTVLTDAVPPVWARGGWSYQSGKPWPVPWAFGTDDISVAFVFATQLVVGPSPRVDGSNNKVLWETSDYPSG